LATRVSVFIDYQNVHFSGHEVWCAYQAPPEDCIIDPLKLADLIVSRREEGGDLHEVHVHRGRPDPRKEQTNASANDQQTQRWGSTRSVHVHRRPLRYPESWPELPAREKGIDVALAIDVVRHAMLGRFDVGVVVSRDTDLIPALEAVRELGGPHIEVATWEGSSRLRLPGQSLWCHMLSEGDFKAVRDPTYYGPRGPYRGPRMPL
jgi:uncharacterized LabA/DUF88 family protein